MYLRYTHLLTYGTYLLMLLVASIQYCFRGISIIPAATDMSDLVNAEFAGL